MRSDRRWIQDSAGEDEDDVRFTVEVLDRLRAFIYCLRTLSPSSPIDKTKLLFDCATPAVKNKKPSNRIHSSDPTLSSADEEFQKVPTERKRESS